MLVGICLLAIGFLLVVVGTLDDRSTPGVQMLAARYFDAVGRKDLPNALSTLAPSQRERWARWVDYQTGNRYLVEGLALRAQPLLDSLWSGPTAGPTEATITARI